MFKDNHTWTVKASNPTIVIIAAATFLIRERLGRFSTWFSVKTRLHTLKYSEMSEEFQIESDQNIWPGKHIVY